MVKFRHVKSLKQKDEKPASKYNFMFVKFSEFCNRTDLHGFKYIVMEKLNFFERLVWGIAVMLSIILAAIFVVTAYRWYARNPIVTVIESTQGAIWDVPFPAVTVCDLNVISKRAARAFSRNLTLPPNVTADNVFRTLQFVPLIHTLNVADSDQKRDLQELQEILDLNSITIETLFRQLSPTSSCSDLVQRCMWKNTLYRCEQLFQHVFTTMNLCCTFNYFGVKPDQTRVAAEFISTKTPRRVASCGYQTALTILVHSDSDDYYSAALASQGSLVFIDNAYNIPDLDSPVRLINPSTEVLIALSPEHTYATAGIKTFNPSQRQCYYNEEVKLSVFTQYSFHNCMAIKGVELLRNVCNCVPFYFPMKEYHRICNFNDIDCVESVMKPSGENLINQDTEPNFQCLPECEHYDYPLEVALGMLANNVPMNGLPFFENMKLENSSVVNVFFNDLVSTRYRRDVYLNWQNILAAFGGLLSLMLGFTLISGFDFVVFFSFGLIYDLIPMVFGNNKKPYKGNVITVSEAKNAKRYNTIYKDNLLKWQRDKTFENGRY